MSAPIETLLSRLDGVRQSKHNSWMCRCPAHNGDGKSLAVTQKDDGRILIYCFAYECEPEDILAAVGMTISDLFPDRLHGHRYAPAKHGVSSLDVLSVMRLEMLTVHFITDSIARGESDPGLTAAAQTSAARIRKALDLCDG